MKLSEVKIQAQIFQWHWNNYPDERGLLCYNLNNSANKIQGSQNKAIGLKEQLLWQATIEKAGFKYLIMRSLQDFIDFKESR